MILGGAKTAAIIISVISGESWRRQRAMFPAGMAIAIIRGGKWFAQTAPATPLNWLD